MWCGNAIKPDCDWQQGRCPHRPKKQLSLATSTIVVAVVALVLALALSIAN